MDWAEFIPPVISKRFTKVETKSSISNFFPLPGESFPEFLLLGGHGDLSAFAAIKLYSNVMPMNNAVKMRSDGFSGIQPRLWDRDKKEFIDGGDPLELLRTPNADVSQCEFLEQNSSFYDITGDNFLLATGRVENPPLELMVVPPWAIDFGTTSSRFGMMHVPDTISISISHGPKVKFNAVEDPKLGLRFFNDARDQELWHMRTFNPLRSASNFRGQSPARSIWKELQQYASGNVNNLSLLKRGTRLSMAWVNNRGEELTEIQWDRMQEEAQKYSGSENAGGTPILDGMDVKPIQLSNRDMEFKDLQVAMLERVSTNYRIPLALLVSQSMTLNNLQTAMLHLFDGAVLPLTTRLYSEFTRFLLPRYKGMENVEFRFNENDIEPLKLRMIETAKAQKEIGVNTTNEIRTVIGYEEADEGGDIILVDSNKVPLADDMFTEDNLTKPGTSNKYFELMQEVKDSNGFRRYSDEEIKAMIEEYSDQ